MYPNMTKLKEKIKKNNKNRKKRKEKKKKNKQGFHLGLWPGL